MYVLMYFTLFVKCNPVDSFVVPPLKAAVHLISKSDLYPLERVVDGVSTCVQLMIAARPGQLL